MTCPCDSANKPCKCDEVRHVGEPADTFMRFSVAERTEVDQTVRSPMATREWVPPRLANGGFTAPTVIADGPRRKLALSKTFASGGLPEARETAVSVNERDSMHGMEEEMDEEEMDEEEMDEEEMDERYPSPGVWGAALPHTVAPTSESARTFSRSRRPALRERPVEWMPPPVVSDPPVKPVVRALSLGAASQGSKSTGARSACGGGTPARGNGCRSCRTLQPTPLPRADPLLPMPWQPGAFRAPPWLPQADPLLPVPWQADGFRAPPRVRGPGVLAGRDALVPGLGPSKVECETDHGRFELTRGRIPVPSRLEEDALVDVYPYIATAMWMMLDIPRVAYPPDYMWNDIRPVGTGRSDVHPAPRYWFGAWSVKDHLWKAHESLADVSIKRDLTPLIVPLPGLYRVDRSTSKPTIYLYPAGYEADYNTKRQHLIAAIMELGGTITPNTCAGPCDSLQAVERIVSRGGNVGSKTTWAFVGFIIHRYLARGTCTIAVREPSFVPPDPCPDSLSCYYPPTEEPRWGYKTCVGDVDHRRFTDHEKQLVRAALGRAQRWAEVTSLLADNFWNQAGSGKQRRDRRRAAWRASPCVAYYFGDEAPLSHRRIQVTHSVIKAVVDLLRYPSFLKFVFIPKQDGRCSYGCKIDEKGYPTAAYVQSFRFTPQIFICPSFFEDNPFNDDALLGMSHESVRAMTIVHELAHLAGHLNHQSMDGKQVEVESKTRELARWFPWRASRNPDNYARFIRSAFSRGCTEGVLDPVPKNLPKVGIPPLPDLDDQDVWRP